MKRVVVDLSSSRPIWSVPRESVATIREALAEGWELVQVSAPTSSDGDGAGASQEAVHAASGAEVYVGWGIPTEVVKAAHDTLRWAHTAAGGVRASITPELQSSGVILTNSQGVHADPIADWTVTAIGYCIRGFHTAVQAQSEARWAKDEFTDGQPRLLEFKGLRIGIVGVGGIGRAIAERCSALGMIVRAVRRHPDRPRPDGVAWVGGPDQLRELVSGSDVLVISAPHTRSTDRLIDERVLRGLPRGAFVLNVARGGLLDENALLTLLDNGHLGGCVLDVFEREPLGERHPFWRRPKVFVTPHVSAVSQRFWERETALLVENIKRYSSGQTLRNVVDFEAGY